MKGIRPRHLALESVCHDLKLVTVVMTELVVHEVALYFFWSHIDEYAVPEFG